MPWFKLRISLRVTAVGLKQRNTAGTIGDTLEDYSHVLNRVGKKVVIFVEW